MPQKLQKHDWTTKRKEKSDNTLSKCHTSCHINSEQKRASERELCVRDKNEKRESDAATAHKHKHKTNKSTGTKQKLSFAVILPHQQPRTAGPTVDAAKCTQREQVNHGPRGLCRLWTISVKGACFLFSFLNGGTTFLFLSPFVLLCLPLSLSLSLAADYLQLLHRVPNQWVYERVDHFCCPSTLTTTTTTTSRVVRERLHMYPPSTCLVSRSWSGHHLINSPPLLCLVQ